MTRAPRADGRARASSLALATVVVGVIAGLGGMVLVLLLHVVQHVAYGYSLHDLRGPESFFEGVRTSSPFRRVGVLAVCGVLAGGGWYCLYRYGRRLVSIEKAVDTGERMPLLETTAHVLLQIVTVALGSPLGREIAPRELAATFASSFVRRARIGTDDAKLLIAAAAGAGLGAVYNAPLGGALFSLEVLLVTFRPRSVAVALGAAAIAAAVAWTGLGSAPTYHVQRLEATPGLVAWAIVVGPLVGVVAALWDRLTHAAHAHAPQGWALVGLSIVNFTVIGVLAIPFPELLGNGRAPAQLGFEGDIGIGLAAALLAIRIVIVASSFRAGAAGGRLTPSLSTGALLALVVGGAWSLVLPGAPSGAYALIGGTAFVAVAMHMPLTAFALALELTWVDLDLCVPMGLAVAGAILGARLVTGRRSPTPGRLSPTA